MSNHMLSCDYYSCDSCITSKNLLSQLQKTIETQNNEIAKLKIDLERSNEELRQLKANPLSKETEAIANSRDEPNIVGIPFGLTKSRMKHLINQANMAVMNNNTFNGICKDIISNIDNEKNYTWTNWVVETYSEYRNTSHSKANKKLILNYNTFVVSIIGYRRDR